MSVKAIVIYLLAAAFVFSVFLRDPGINDYHRARFADMVYGKAHRPFVYRTLLPSTVRALTAAVPPGAREALRGSLGETAFLGKVFSRFRWEKEHLTEYLVACVLMYGSLLGFGLAVRYLFKGLYSRPPGWLADSLPALSVLLLLPFFSRASYLYDFPALALFTLGAALMLRRRWKAYLVVFLLASINKETSILLTLIYAVHLYGVERHLRGFHLKMVSAQIALFFAVKAALYMAFRDNPGSLVEFHLIDHNIDLVDYSATAVVSLALVAMTVSYRWKEKPLFLRDSLWILPTLVLLTSLFGFLDELRDYYEAYPIVLLLVVDSISRMRGSALDRAGR